MKKMIPFLILVLLCGALSACSRSEKQTTYTVTFDSQGGSAVESQNVTSGNPAIRPTAPERDGFFFNGWYTSSAASDETEWRFDRDRVRSDITLYAGWSAGTAEEQVTVMYITINGNKLEITLAQNSSVDALIGILKQHDITYIAQPYGGFEIVGNIGQSLPTNNSQITTQAGDVILYQGNSIVIFYGQNSWSYTRIGKINGYSASELKTLLGAESGSVEVRLSLR